MFLKYCLIISALIFSNALFAEVVQIDSKQLKELLEAGVTVIDVRTPPEWEQTGIVEGSLPIMFFNQKRQPLTEQWMQQVSRIITPQDELVLICRTGSRSGLIATYLTKQHQFVRVYNVQRGIREWIKQGNKTVKPN